MTSPELVSTRTVVPSTRTVVPWSPPNSICYTTVSPFLMSISSDVRLPLPLACSTAVLMASSSGILADWSVRTSSAEALSSLRLTTLLPSWAMVRLNCRPSGLV